MSNNKATFVFDEKRFSHHRENLQTILGTTHSIPESVDLGQFTINYNLNLSMDQGMLGKLRSMVEMAEDEDVDFSLDLSQEDIQVYSECMRLLDDLKRIAEERVHRSLWRSEK